MTTLQAIFTDAGMAAVIAADAAGLQGTITELAFGDTGHTPDASATALQNEVARVAISSFAEVEGALHLTGVLAGETEFTVREFGVFLDDGTMLAIWSDPVTPLSAKVNGTDLLLSFVLALAGLPSDSVTVNVVDGSSLEIISRLIEINTAQAEILTRQIGYDASQTVQDGRLDQIETDLLALEVPANLETRLVDLENFDAALSIPPDLSVDLAAAEADIVSLDTRVGQLETDFDALGVPPNLATRLTALETFDSGLVIPPDVSDVVDGHTATLAGLGTASTYNVGTASNQVPTFGQLPMRTVTLTSQSLYTGAGPDTRLLYSDIGNVTVANGVLTITQRYHYERGSFATDVGGTN
jgi:class 3 adenylate cyclase